MIEQNPIMPDRRYWNILKGIGILCVVLGLSLIHIFGVIFLVGVIVYMLYKKQKPIFQKTTVLISFLVACSPILWYVVVNNHASLHPHLEWREWVVSVFAACVLVLSLLREKTDERILV